MATPRLHLFYGTDSRVSLLAIQKWVALFDAKYGQGLRYSLDADELGGAATLNELEKILGAQTLFAEPTLVVVRRFASLDFGRSQANTKALVELLNRQWPHVPSTLTLAFFEPADMAPNNGLLTGISAIEANDGNRTHLAQLPASTEVSRYIANYLRSQGYTADTEAVRWLGSQYRNLERSVRLQRRLKATDPLLDDERGWWLVSLLNSATARCVETTLSLADVQAAQPMFDDPVSAFTFAQALANSQWDAARSALAGFSQGADESAYFGLYAATNWQIERGRERGLSERQRLHALRLLAELELIGKNTTVPHLWLLELLIDRLQAGENAYIIPPRTLWLATLPRS